MCRCCSRQRERGGFDQNLCKWEKMCVDHCFKIPFVSNRENVDTGPQTNKLSGGCSSRMLAPMMDGYVVRTHACQTKVMGVMDRGDYKCKEGMKYGDGELGM